MKENKEFYENLYVKYFNWAALVVMLLLSLFTFNHYLMFLVYGVVLCALSYMGFKQYIFDIVGCLALMILTGVQYGFQLNYLTSTTIFTTIKRIVSISCVCLTFINFFLIRHNYKIFVLKENDHKDEITFDHD